MARPSASSSHHWRCSERVSMSRCLRPIWPSQLRRARIAARRCRRSAGGHRRSGCAAVSGGWPCRLAFSPGLLRALGAEVRHYDLVHIHSLFLFPQFAAYRAATGGWCRTLSRREARSTRTCGRRGRAVKAITEALWQRRMLQHAAAIHVTSDDEARLIADIAPAVPRAVVPNGIECSHTRRSAVRRRVPPLVPGEARRAGRDVPRPHLAQEGARSADPGVRGAATGGPAGCAWRSWDLMTRA